MKMKDVLNFYLGCEVEYEGILNGKEIGEELKANKHDMFYVPKIEAVKGRKVGILKSIDVDMKGNYRRARIGRKGLQSHWGKPNFKLRLRKLSSMTEEEAIQLAALSEWEGHFNDVKVNIGKYDNDIIVSWQGANESRDQFNATGELFYCAEQVIWLCKKGFDIFQLIESNQAIDINTQTEKQ